MNKRARARARARARTATPAVLVVAVVLFAASVAAAADKRFAEAESLAKRKEPLAAIDLYKGLLADGEDGPALRYNLGTLLLEEGKIGEAVLHLRAARRLAPRDDDVKHNLDVALEARTDRLAGDAVGSPLRTLGESTPPLLARAAFAVPLAILALLVAALGFVSGRARTILRVVAGAFVVVTALGGALFAARKSFEGRREAVVFVDSTPARKDPAPDAAEAFVAHAGLHGEVVGESNESGSWVRVRFENGLEAWLSASDVGFVD